MDGAIHRRGGPEILAECRKLRASHYGKGLATGRAVATTAGRLPARHVIHTVGPRWSATEDRSELLVSCYRESLRVAAQLGARTVAFPAISTGIYSWPLDDGGADRGGDSALGRAGYGRGGALRGLRRPGRGVRPAPGRERVAVRVPPAPPGPLAPTKINNGRMAGMSTTNTLRTAVPDDAPEIGSLLARAFDDDPMMRCFFPDATTRQASMERYFTTVFGRQYVHHGLCERTASAAAFWVPAEDQAKAVPDADTVQELQACSRGPRRAVRADRRGRRRPHGRTALVPRADRCRPGRPGAEAREPRCCAPASRGPTRQGMPVYLESSKESNVPVYEHFGFKVRDELTVPAGGRCCGQCGARPRPDPDPGTRAPR